MNGIDPVKSIVPILLATAVSLAAVAPMESAAQQTLPPGFTPEGFALLRQRAEAGDAKAQALYRKLLASSQSLAGAVSNFAEDASELAKAKADIRKAEAGTGFVTADMLAEVSDALVVNGFYVGMSLDDAMARLVRAIPGRKVRRRPHGLALAEEVERRGLEGIWLGDSDETFCLAQDGRVVRILIPPDRVGDWLGLHSVSSSGRAAELAGKFKAEARLGKPDLQDLAVEFAWMWLFGIPLPEKPFPQEERAVLDLAGKGLAVHDDQLVYQYGVVRGTRVTYFGEEREVSDAGITREDGRRFLDGWLKIIRALGEYPVEGTLRLDAEQFTLPKPSAALPSRRRKADSAGKGDDTRLDALSDIGAL